MPSLIAQIQIDAPRQRVWQALIQKERWREWNTFLFDCDPTKPFERGQQVFLSLRRLPRELETEFDATVTLVQPDVCLQFRVSGMPGWSNEHVFELQDIGVGRTKYVHREIFSGFLTRAFLPFIRNDERRGMDRMAWDLKRYLEKGSSSSLGRSR